MTTAATLERHRFADELTSAGPDAPTLCAGWTTRDLAAHIVLRDSRPDALPGVLVPALSSYTDRVQSGIAETDWERLIDQVRSGPPPWSPTRLDPIDRAVNTTEFFVHLEDIRRARPGWEPRSLDPDLVDDLDRNLRRSAKLMGRRARAGLVLAPDDGRSPITAREGDPTVVARGPVGELVLLLLGRQEHARVGYSGPESAVAAIRSADFGI
jgi:uncharacterized protein (TIGR03085 family)